MEAKISARKMAELKRFIKSQGFVKLAYLFGSQAGGNAGPLSDIDLAFYLDEKLGRVQALGKKVFLINRVSKILGTDRVDVVVMNNMPDSFNFEVIKNGKAIADSGIRTDVEVGIMGRYLDRRYYDQMFASRFIGKVAREGL